MPNNNNNNADAQQLQEENEALQEERQILREVITQLTEENATLREDNENLNAQNASYLEQLVMWQKRTMPTLAPSTSSSRDDNDNGSADDHQESGQQIEQYQRTIDDLQQRVVHLVQEKLSLHNLIEALEHELMLVMHGRNNNTGGDDGRGKKPELDESSSDPKKAKQQLHDKMLLEKMEQATLNESSPPRRGKMGGLFSSSSNRSRSTSYDDATNDLGGAAEFDIRQELEHQLHRQSTAVPRLEQRSTVQSEEGYDRASWDRMKDDGDLAKMFQSTDQTTTQSDFLQKAIDKRRSTSLIGRLGILGSGSDNRSLSSSATLLTPAPQVGSSSNKPAEERSLVGSSKNRRGTSSTIIMDCDDALLDKFDSRRDSTSGTVDMNDGAQPRKGSKKFKDSSRRSVAATSLDLLI